MADVIPATQIRNGMIVVHNKELHRVLSVNHVTPGNWRGMVQVKLRNLRSGSQLEHRFGSTDKVDKASLETHDMEYLYSDPNGHHFMNLESYETIALTDETLGDSLLYLLPNMPLKVDFYEANPVAVELPITVTLEVSETEPPMKGATASASYKPAKMQTGLMVQVPQFIETGTKLTIDTRDNTYVSRA